MNKRNLTEGNVEVYQQKDVCCRWSVAKNRTNAPKIQSTSMNGQEYFNERAQKS